MDMRKVKFAGIPALVFGTPSDKAFLSIHGRYSRKEEAESFARVVTPKGYQVVSFDLPEHGERTGEAYPCTVRNGVRDLRAVYDAVKDAHRSLSLYACSLGAYFSLVAYGDVAFARRLFVSPILDMERKNDLDSETSGDVEKSYGWCKGRRRRGRRYFGRKKGVSWNNIFEYA